MEAIKFLLALIFGILVITGLGFLSYKAYEFYAPRYAAVDRKVFEETKGYNDGMVRDLENIMLQYNNANAEAKEALRAVVLHRFSVYPEDRLPPHLLAFYNKVRNEL